MGRARRSALAALAPAWLLLVPCFGVQERAGNTSGMGAVGPVPREDRCSQTATLSVSVVVFGFLGDVEQEEDAAAVGLASKWILGSVLRAVLEAGQVDLGAGVSVHADRRRFEPYEEDRALPGLSPLRRTRFGYELRGLGLCSAEAMAQRFCNMVREREQSLHVAVLRSLAVSALYPREAIATSYWQGGEDSRSFLHFSVEVLGHAALQTGCEPDRASGSDAQESVLFLPDCPTNSARCRREDAAVGRCTLDPYTCLCDGGYEGAIRIDFQRRQLSGTCSPTTTTTTITTTTSTSSTTTTTSTTSSTTTTSSTSTSSATATETSTTTTATSTSTQTETSTTASTSTTSSTSLTTSTTRTTSSTTSTSTTSTTSSTITSTTSSTVTTSSTFSSTTTSTVTATSSSSSTTTATSSTSTRSTSTTSSTTRTPIPPLELRVNVVDAQSRSPARGATVTVFRDEQLTEVHSRQVTGDFPGNAGTVIVPGVDFDQMYVVVDLEGYSTTQRTVELQRDCPRAGVCTIQVTISRLLRGGELVVTDSGCWLYTKTRGEFQMRAVLEWDDRINDLDIWARSWDCGDDMERRYDCGRGSSNCGWTSVRDNHAVRNSEARSCASHQGSVSNSQLAVDADGVPRPDAVFGNQFPKWVFFSARVLRLMNWRLPGRSNIVGQQPEPQPVEGLGDWPEGNFIMLDVDATRGWGPETVTFRNVPPGTYQLVVNRYTAGGDRPISDTNPRVTIRIGTNSAFQCQPLAACAAQERQIWYVADVVIREDSGNAGGGAGGEPVWGYKFEILDSQETMRPLVLQSQPTSAQFTQVHGNPGAPITQDRLDRACRGECVPVAPRELRRELQKCIPRLDPDGGAAVTSW